MAVRTLGRRGAVASLLDVAVDVLVADPSASLAEVAEAAGIGRTTLHKHYATRDDLMRAVGHRAIDLWEQVMAAADRSEADDGSLHALAEAMVPIGRRWRSVEPQALAVLKRGQARGVLRPDVADFWLLQTFYSLVYVAAESVGSGHLAPRDAPDLVVETFVRGLGVPQS